MLEQQCKEYLKGGIEEWALQRAAPGEFFTLSSGGQSTYYLNLREITLRAECNFAIVVLITEIIKKHNIMDDPSKFAIGGPALGAIPIISGMSSLAGRMGLNQGTPSPTFFFVRKQEKEHGTKQLIEGPNIEGKNAIIIEDVTTTGSSAGHAIIEARKAGAEVDHVISVIDREEGGRDAMRDLRVQFHPLFTKSDFGL
jgi:orotate phosphoribosyltransferase